MRLFDKLKNFFSKILKINNNLNSLGEKEKVKQLPMSNINNNSKAYETIDLPEDELVSFSEEVLDTNSRVSEEKFKHNLKVLMKRAKENGRIDKFMLIREDNFFPTDWEWRVLSKNTNLEKTCTPLSYELRKAYALEKSGINPYKEINGIKIPTVSKEQETQALSQIDKTFGSVLLPSRFRSTKHFTINTPLEVTGDYNFVTTNRDYIIIDNISTFLSSKYGYSVSYHDAYLDISHESLPISKEAVVLINEEKYNRIMSDEKVAKELSQRKVVRFKGDTFVAINMILTEMGALPSKISCNYANYDEEIMDILDSSMKNLAEKNALFFDKSHGGKLKPDGGHFSNYYDDKNNDYEKGVKELITFLKQKFPKQAELFPDNLSLTKNNCETIVEKLGTTNLSIAIEEYNKLANNRVKKTLEEYKKDRENITPEIHQKFVETVALINDFYKNNITYEGYEEKMQTEDAIMKFIQGATVKEQLQATKIIWELLPSKISNKENTTIKDTNFNMETIIKNAITKGISTEQVEETKSVEYKAYQDFKSKGVIRSD